MPQSSTDNFQKTSILIIGAGPAGMVTALFLARSGIQSTIVEKGSFPKPKPCADCVTGNTLRILKELAPDLLKELVNKDVLKPMFGINAFSSNNSKIKFDFLPLEPNTDESSCYTIKREDFDHALYMLMLKEPNIRILQNFHINDIKIDRQSALVTEKNGQRMEAELIVNASGSNSNLNQKLNNTANKEEHTAIGIRAYFENVKLERDDYCELFLSRKLMPGGLYVSPLPNNAANVNLVLRLDKVKKHQIDLKKTFEEFVTQHPLLKEKFAEARLLENFSGSQLRLGTSKRKIHGSRYIMVGDAAGLIDILSANGIPQAFMSGKIAASHIAECIREKDFSESRLKTYEKDIYKATNNYLRLGRIASPFMKSEFVLNMVDQLLNKFSIKLENNKTLEALVYNKKLRWNPLKPEVYRRFFFGMKN